VPSVAVIGAAGFAGAIAARILDRHPAFDLVAVTARGDDLGRRLDDLYPHHRVPLALTSFDDLPAVDAAIVAYPHGVAAPVVARLRERDVKVVDLSADFRLEDEATYEAWYGDHGAPHLFGTGVYGLPELHREEMQTAGYISSAGCLATPTILGLYPLFKEGLVDPQKPAVVEVKTGSSGAGAEEGLASHHPERSGAMRSFKPTGHRHTAEVEQELSEDPSVADHGRRPIISFSATAIEAVRGVLSTSHVFLNRSLTDKDIWQVYRKYYAKEPFIRLVKESGGIYRYPEPKILTGSNFCDIGFELDSRGNRLVVIAAVDNLMKGAAGQAVQAMNIRCGCPEEAGLEVPGLHPI